MQTTPVNIPFLYEQIKFWSVILGAGGAVAAAFYWVKDIKDNHLKHIQESLSSMSTDLKDQTSQLVTSMRDNTQELKDMRRDMFTAFVQPQKVRARRKK